MREEQDTPFSLRVAMNTYNPALTVIKDKGYTVYLVPDTRKGVLGEFLAISDRGTISASDPLTLLGLVAIWESLGANWRDTEGDPYGNLMRITFAQDDYRDMDDAEFGDTVQYLATLFDALGLPFSPAVSRRELAERMRGLAAEVEHVGDADIAAQELGNP